jgi:hypothetical protein
MGVREGHAGNGIRKGKGRKGMVEFKIRKLNDK